MTIRLANREDVIPILAISNHYAATTAANFAVEPESLDSWLATYDNTHEFYPWVVAERANQIVGFAKASPWKGRCAYNFSAEVTIYLHPDARGEGLGRRLYSRLIHILQLQGYTTAIGGITLPNAPSVALHESLGFQRAATFERVGWKFDRWHDVGYWQLHLQDETGAAPDVVRPVISIHTSSTS